MMPPKSTTTAEIIDTTANPAAVAADRGNCSRGAGIARPMMVRWFAATTVDGNSVRKPLSRAAIQAELQAVQEIGNIRMPLPQCYC